MKMPGLLMAREYIFPRCPVAIAQKRSMALMTRLLNARATVGSGFTNPILLNIGASPQKKDVIRANRKALLCIETLLATIAVWKIPLTPLQGGLSDCFQRELAYIC
jgi:hypothetical protein